MIITLNGLSALRVLRQLRKERVDIARLRHVDAPVAELGQDTRWSSRKLADSLSAFPCVLPFSNERPLSVAVPKAGKRLRIKGVKNTLYSSTLPKAAFVRVADGLFVSSPELLFVELARLMPFETHVLLGMELCGMFARDALDPRSGEATFGCPPATSAEQLRVFLDGCKRLNGMGQARESLEWVLDNAWSPMEAAVALCAELPLARCGYDLWPLDLNVRYDTTHGAEKATRVPDLMFRGTNVGLNYDGEEHLPLQALVDAATRLARNPGEESAEAELDAALKRVREAAVADKRRDRDLGASGKIVFSITKEDLYEAGGMDRVMTQVIEAIEASGKRNLHAQRLSLESRVAANIRQQFVWSLLPGKAGIEAAHRYEELVFPNPNPHPIVYSYKIDGDAMTLVDVRVL
jgi:hypothetical protein